MSIVIDSPIMNANKIENLRIKAQSILTSLSSSGRQPTDDEVALLRLLGWDECPTLDGIEAGWLIAIMKWDSGTWPAKYISAA
jgi:hypothetical protein